MKAGLKKCTKEETQNLTGGVFVSTSGRAPPLVGDIMRKDQEIDSNDIDGEYYIVRLRGAPGREPIRVAANDLTKIETVSEQVMSSEELREQLYIEYKKESASAAVRKRVMTRELADELSFLIDDGTDTTSLAPIRRELQNPILVREVEIYYMNEGSCPIGGRQTTSYYKLIGKPFLTCSDSGGSCNVEPGSLVNGKSANDIVKGLTDELAKDPDQACWVLLRAFAYSQLRIHTQFREQGDRFIDVFLITFFAIQVLRGNVDKLKSCKSRIDASIQKAFQEHGNDLCERYARYGIMSKSLPGTTLGATHLTWCFCMMFLKVGCPVQASFAGDARGFELLLPVPYLNTTHEQQMVVQATLACRPENPSSYLYALQMFADLKDMVPKENRADWLYNGLRLAQVGLELATKLEDPLHLYTFTMIDLFFKPTRPEGCNGLTCRQAQDIMDQADRWKQSCEHYVPIHCFEIGQAHKGQFKAYMKAFGISGDMVIPPFPDIHMYCSARFGETGYYKSGGKFDRLATKYHCANCSTLVSKRLFCSRCKHTTYCGATCQREHWKEHKKKCTGKKKK